MVILDLAYTACEEGALAVARGFAHQGLAAYEEVGHRPGVGTALGSLGDVAAAEGDHLAARGFYQRSLAIWRELGLRHYAATNLELLATRVDPGQGGIRAARLLGAAEALREAIGAPLLYAWREEVHRGVAALRDALGEEALAAAWAEGRAMDWEEAADYALEE